MGDEDSGEPGDREDVAAFEAEPGTEDAPAEAAAEDVPLPDQAAGGPSPDGEDPAFLGPDG